MAHQHTAACAHGGGAAFAGFLHAIFRAAGAFARRVRERRQKRRQEWATYEALRGLDDRTLRDIGYHRTDLSSAAGKFHGDAS
jgi:hypothetical protein